MEIDILGALGRYFPERMTGKGHEDAFPRPRLRARCRLGEPTFAGMGGKEEDAPKAVTRGLAIERRAPRTAE
jgi:hypothetical protein